MAVPKKKTSVSRKGLRRAGHTHKLARAFSISCPSCGAPTLRNYACPECGTYKNHTVIKFKEEKEVEETPEA